MCNRNSHLFVFFDCMHLTVLPRQTMKQLKDLCLDCLALNLSGNITSVSRGLAPVHKELLLERLMNHDRLTTDYLPHITYNLVAATMKHLVINRCAQVRDDLLQLVSFSGCRLTYLSITGCKSVTSEYIFLTYLLFW